jgi:hypothetical protein
MLSYFASNLTPMCERCVLTIRIILMFFLCGAAEKSEGCHLKNWS